MNDGGIGINVAGDGGVNYDNAAGLVRALRSKYSVAINSPRLTMMIQDAGALAIHRRKLDSDNDDDAHLRGGLTDPVAIQTAARQFVRNRHNEAPPGAALYLTNEPGAVRLDVLNLWTLYAQDELQAVNRLGCILNLSEGNPPLEQWGMLAPCIKRAVQRGDLIGHHDYFNRDLTDAYNFHAGRWLPAQRAYGGQWVITEFGFDAGYNGTGWNGQIGQGEYADLCAIVLPKYKAVNAAVCLFSYNQW